MESILIVKFGALGDVVRTAYILPGLLEKYQDAKIYWLTSNVSANLLRYNPFIHEIVTPGFNFESLLSKEFDLTLSFDDEIQTLELLKNIRTNKIIGAFLDGGKPAYDGQSAPWFDMGLISRFGKNRADELKKLNTYQHNDIFASLLGITIKEPSFFNSYIIERKTTKLFDNEYFNIGINSGADSRWFSKQLLLEETISLMMSLLSSKIKNKQTRIYVLGGKNEVERHALLKKEINSNRVIDPGNDNSLLEFAAIIKHCDYLITSDSLALHLAISQRVKNLSFFTSTSAAEIGTFGTGVKLISLSEDYCSYKKDADNKTITAERILKEMYEHIRKCGISLGYD
ncbi:MAG: glycosyltransferase family 9 protein [Smithella sp.]